METIFTPWMSLLGGGIIGVATVMLMYFHGRIMGATGLISGIMFPTGAKDWSWRIALLAGMVTGPLAYLVLFGEMPTVDVPVSTIALMVGGVIVGFGASIGSGCTSGHGICGLARLSPRSLVATLTFMAATGVTVYLVRHVFGGGI